MPTVVRSLCGCRRADLLGDDFRGAPAVHGPAISSPACPGAARRAGFTMIEILIVIGVAGILYMLMAPRIGETRAKSQLRAARQQLSAAFASARAAARQHGR